MSDPADIATGVAGGAAGTGLLWAVLARFLNRGERAESKLEERLEGALADHKAKIEGLLERVAKLEEWAVGRGRTR